jgi:hypothetical protein
MSWEAGAPLFGDATKRIGAGRRRDDIALAKLLMEAAT